MRQLLTEFNPSSLDSETYQHYTKGESRWHTYQNVG